VNGLARKAGPFAQFRPREVRCNVKKMMHRNETKEKIYTVQLGELEFQQPVV
jgi:hypothetical protein